MKNKKKRAGRDKGKVWQPVLAVLALAVIAAAAVVIVVRPRGSKPKLAEGDFRILVEGDQMTISWPEPQNADVLRIYVYDKEKKSYVLYQEYTENSAIFTGIQSQEELPVAFQAVRYTTNLLGRDCESRSRREKATLIPVELEQPVLTGEANAEEKTFSLRWNADERNAYEVYRMDDNGNWQLFREVNGSEAVVQFGEEGDMEVPRRSQPVKLAVRAIRQGEGCLYYGDLSEEALVERDDLLGTDPMLSWEQTDVRKYVLSWEETKGSTCELQEWSDIQKDWVTLAVSDWSGELSYETDRLPSSREMKFRVIAYNSEAEKEAMNFAAGPSEVSFRTEISSLYCTIWPVVELELYSDVSGDNAVGKVPAGEALCVLDEENGRFMVRYRDTYGYVDSGYCMIDLPEYLGDLCEYNITNSYDSIFRVHEYDIPEITGEVVQGYESICLADDELLVPYLYPCAQRLQEAAEKVLADGYILRIYDAFRPNEATRYLYDTVSALLNERVPSEEEITEAAGIEEEETLTRYEMAARAKQEKAKREEEIKNGEPLQLPIFPGTPLNPDGTPILSGSVLSNPDGTPMLNEDGTPVPLPAGEGEEGQSVQTPEEQLALFWENQRNLWMASIASGLAAAQEAGMELSPAPAPEGKEGKDQTAPPTLEEFLAGLTPEEQVYLASGGYIPGMENVVPEESGPTYQEIMTNGSFRLSAFLAAVTSAHNRGIALDLTLVDRQTDEALEMQSSMHDLSWNSILSLNNENADKLSEYMLGVGFRGLTSEWWHFQDDETREKLQLNSYLAKGVAVTGWKKDDTGWKYRQEDGSYLCNTTETVEGTSCTFDADGYAK